MTLLLLAALLVASGLVSGSETAVFSLKPGERRRLAERSPTIAAVLDRPSKLLVTLLLSNLLVNVAYFSVSARVSLSLIEQGLPWLSAAVAAGSVVMLVIAGEIVPKTMALVSPPTAVRKLAPLLLALRVVLSPAAAVVGGASRLLEALVLGGRSAEDLAPADFKSAIAGQSAMGTYHAIELALLHDVVDFGLRRARNLMVPRVDVTFLDARADRRRWIATMAARPYRVYPVCEGSPDEILGTVAAVDVLTRPDAPLAELLQPALFAPISIVAEDLVERMRRAGVPLAILLDEYGGMEGVVGFSALTQSVLGEIDAPAGAANPPIARHGRDSLVVRGECPLHLLEDEAGLVFPVRRADTMAGALAEAIGRVPRAGDEVLLPGWRMRVTAMAGRRVARVLVRPVHPAQDQGAPGDGAPAGGGAEDGGEP